MNSVKRLVTFHNEHQAEMFDRAANHGMVVTDKSGDLHVIRARVEGDPDEVVTLRGYLGSLQVGALAVAVSRGMPAEMLNERKSRRAWTKKFRKEGLL